MTTQEGFITDLRVWDIRPIPGHDLWLTQYPLEYYSPALKRKIVVPAGYRTDLASIPKWGHIIMHPASKEIRVAAVIHDRCYTDLNDQMTRAEADLVLREAMGFVPSPAPKWQRYVVWMFVRCSFRSRGYWEKYQDLKAKVDE